MDSERYKQGLAVMQDMAGETSAEEVAARFRDLHPDFERFVIEFVMGDLYGRPGLGLKTRLLCTVAALTVLGRQEPLKGHLERALGAGATRTELEEVMLQMCAFGGFPATWDALTTARTVFKQVL